MLKKIFVSTFQETEKEKNLYLTDSTSFDVKTLVICILTAFSLSVIYYWGNYSFVRNLLVENRLLGILTQADQLFLRKTNNLGELAYWVLVLSIFYFVLPCAVIHFIFKEKIRDYGLQLKGAFKDYHLYILMLLFMIPLVLYFSTTKSFQSRYPFLHFSTGNFIGQDFWKWEILYSIQFFTLEFFFRGFILHGLKKRFGYYSVFIMTIPYCMIHFGKPMPETLAAIVAGIILGTLSLKSRSIFLGFLIHVSVGLGMDLAAMWQKGFFN